MNSDYIQDLDREKGPQQWNRANWLYVWILGQPNIHYVIKCLGLSLSTTDHGTPRFDHPNHQELSDEVDKLSKELPQEQDIFLDLAAAPQSLNKELEDLLKKYGPAIWGKDTDRSCFLTMDPTKNTYNKRLFYEDPEHRNIIKIHLHRWIFLKACHNIHDRNSERPSGENEYDQLADIGGEGLSPHSTPQSLTPPDMDTATGTNREVKSINPKKRRRRAYSTVSDDEETTDATPVKRSHSTMPISRKDSPKKSLNSAVSGGMENTPPLPVHSHRFSPAPGSGPEDPRTQLAPLSSNKLNGASRSLAVSRHPAPSPVSFTAVNCGSFTAVNAPLPTKECLRASVREASQENSKELQRPFPANGHRHSNNYTSPYAPSPHNSAPIRPPTDPPRSVPPATPVTTSNNHIFHTANSTATSTREKRHPKKDSHALQYAQHAHIAPQPSSQPPLQRQNPQLHYVLHPNPQPHTQHSQLPSHPPFQPQQQAPTQLSNPYRPPAHHFGWHPVYQSHSKSRVPHTQAAHNKPPTALNSQPAPAPAPSVQAARAYSTQLVPAPEAPPTAPMTSLWAPPSHVQPAPSHHAPHQTVLKSQHPEPAHMAQPAPAIARQVVPTADLRLLQCEVTTDLFNLLFPRPTMSPDEVALLQRPHALWFHGESLFRSELAGHYDLVSKILTAWLHERQTIAALRHSMAANPGVSHVGLVDRLLAMNDLRAMRLKWKNMSPIDGMSPEDLLCMAFKAMTNTEGSEYLLKDGLARLELSDSEFFPKEDGKIIVQRREASAM